MNFPEVNLINYVLKQIPRSILPVDGNYNGTYFPGIRRTIFNGKKTIVFFSDGTKASVECSEGDKYDKQTALAYAICKRLFGCVNEDGTINPNGFGCYMKRIVDAGYDQQKAEEEIEAKKREAKERHAKLQAEQHEAAFRRKVEARAEEMRIRRAAEELLAKESKKTTTLNEDTCIKKTCTRGSCKNPVDEAYVRPSKPFSQFTPEEKRAYWREQNKKRSKKTI